MDRQSLESDRLHLLSHELNLPPSAQTSRATSLLSRASSHSTLKAKQTQTQAPTSAATPPLTKAATSARRFTKSEEEYLVALRAWVEEKQYVSLGDTTLEGFYGKKTMDMYAAKPGPNWGKKKQSKTQITPEDLDINGRRRTIAVVSLDGKGKDEQERVERARRKSVREWLVRR
jgi:hypothetical protein